MIQIGGGGGAATPAGSDTQVQFNDGGAFGGNSGLVFDKTTGKLTIGKQLVISSGAVTASTPLLDLAQTWNSAGTTFTGLKFNVTDTASAAASNLIDLQVGGASQFKVSKAGTVSSLRYIIGFGTDAALVANGAFPYLVTATGNVTRFSAAGGFDIAGNGYYGLTSNATSGLTSSDTILARDAAGTFAQRNGTNAQTFRIYNTFTDASNYERGKISWVTNVLQIGTEKAGTGTARALALQTDGTTRLTVEAAGSLTVADANNIAVGTTTGTKIGTATTQKLGFYNATPVVQPAAVADATGAGDVVAQLNLLLARMRDLGLIAT